MIKLFLTIIVVAMLAGVFRAPAFLICERPLKKADCVVVMLGQKYPDRKQTALSLIEKGVADVMLIPAWRKMIRYDGSQKPSVEKTMAVAARPQVSINLLGQRLDLYENTHLELLLAREMMRKLGMKSAVVVSSPRHMRRIQLIAGQVFAEGGYDIGLKSTSLVSYRSLVCVQSPGCRKHVAGEYLKIGWFL